MGGEHPGEELPDHAQQLLGQRAHFQLGDLPAPVLDVVRAGGNIVRVKGDRQKAVPFNVKAVRKCGADQEGCCALS